MAISTYAELQTAAANWLNRSDLTARIPEFIALLEGELRTEEGIESIARAPLTLDAEFVTLPDDCSVLTAIYFDDGTRQGPLEIVTPERLAALQGRMIPMTSALPRFVAVTDNGRGLLVAPTPDQAYGVSIEYAINLEDLATNSENWLLKSYPGVYLYGTLLQAEPFLKNDERVGTWQGLYDRHISKLRSFIERRKWSANTMIMRPKRPLP